MKLITLLFATLIVSACNSNKTIVEEKTATNTEMNTNNDSKTEKTVSLRSDSGYSVMEDTTGKFYIEENDGNKMVFSYMISEKGPEGTADGDKGEALMFEFSESDLPISLSNEQLKKVKMMYQKQCFCRDAGFYWVTDGSLSVSKTGDKYAVAASFKIDKIMHELNGVTQTISAQ